jgi:hypothetical protein
VAKLRKLLTLPAADRKLLFQAGALLGAVRLGLWILPFSRLRNVLARVAGSRHPAGGPPAERVAWAVSKAARYVPGSTCLVQALATKRLLANLGHDAQLHIGVAKDGTDRLEAHAWVESGGKILVGALSDLSRYTPLPPLPAERH